MTFCMLIDPHNSSTLRTLIMYHCILAYGLGFYQICIFLLHLNSLKKNKYVLR